MQTISIVIIVGLFIPLSGCIGGNTDYTITTEQPTTGAVFDGDMETEVEKEWSHTMIAEVEYSVPDNWVSAEGNVTGPNRTWSERPRIVGVEFVNGSVETRAHEYLRVADRWRAHFVLGPSEVHEFQIRAVADGEILDSMNVTVTAS